MPVVNYEYLVSKIASRAYENDMPTKLCTNKPCDPEICERCNGEPTAIIEELKNMTKKKNQDYHEKRRAESRRLHEEFEDDLREFITGQLGIGTVKDTEFKPLFDYAWEEGHSEGYRRVLDIVVDLLCIIKPFVSGPFPGHWVEKK